jgi:hypothetical protein
MKEIEYILPESLNDLKDQHFTVYNPTHKNGDDWHYEYANLQDAVNDGCTFEELSKALKRGYIRICLEIIGVEEDE